MSHNEEGLVHEIEFLRKLTEVLRGVDNAIADLIGVIEGRCEQLEIDLPLSTVTDERQDVP